MCYFGFPLKTRESVGIGCKRFGKDFDRDGSLEACVRGSLDRRSYERNSQGELLGR
jgi:hypothetical protein